MVEESPIISNQPRALSGRRLTIILLAVLLSTGGLFYWVTTAYSQYNEARRQTDRAWRELATSLDSRYRSLDKVVAKGVGDQSIDRQLEARWHSARDAFSGTSLSRLQIESAIKLEQMVKELPKETRDAVDLPDATGQLIAAYQKSVQTQEAIGQSTGSRLLKVMLNLPDPVHFDLTH